MHLCKRHVWICMDMGQHGYSMAMLNPWCPVPSTSHGEPWKYHGTLWKPHGVPWCTGSHPWCAMENLWCPMESPWCSMENPRDTMEYFCKGCAVLNHFHGRWGEMAYFGGSKTICSPGDVAAGIILYATSLFHKPHSNNQHCLLSHLCIALSDSVIVQISWFIERPQASKSQRPQR